MKRFLEFLRMYSSRVSKGLLSASAVMLSVLILASPAMGLEDRVIGLPSTQTKFFLGYCNTSEICFKMVRVERAGNLPVDDSTGTDGILAANDTPTDDDTPASTTSTKDTTTENGDGTSADTGSGEFSGSSTPASPDLSIGEEKDLISGGWN